MRLVFLQEAILGKFRKTFLILMGSVAVVLLIACANVGNLILAMFLARRKEIAIRL